MHKPSWVKHPSHGPSKRRAHLAESCGSCPGNEDTSLEALPSQRDSPILCRLFSQHHPCPSAGAGSWGLQSVGAPGCRTPLAWVAGVGLGPLLPTSEGRGDHPAPGWREGGTRALSARSGAECGRARRQLCCPVSCGQSRAAANGPRQPPAAKRATNPGQAGSSSQVVPALGR